MVFHQEDSGLVAGRIWEVVSRKETAPFPTSSVLSPRPGTGMKGMVSQAVDIASFESAEGAE